MRSVAPFGVVMADRVLTSQCGNVEGPPPASLVEAHQLAARHGLRQLWFTPGAMELVGYPTRLRRRDEVGGPFLFTGALARPKGQEWLRSRLSCWSSDHYVEVLFPSCDATDRARQGLVRPSNPFALLDFGPELLGELLSFVEATGTLWRGSGALTSDSWLREHYGSKLTPTELAPPSSDTLLESDLNYARRGGGERERKARNCLAFDVNAMYLGAASSLPLPTGPVVHAPEWLGKPKAAYVRYTDRWMSLPTMDYEELGGRLPDEGYYWPETHRFLEPWYRMLRDARNALLDDGGPALEAVKQIYRQGVGRFGSTKRARDGDPLYQPYWRHAVQAEARCRLLRRISSLAVKPVAVEVDCLYFLTNHTSPTRFAKDIGLPLDDSAGHFKFAGAMPGKVAREVLASSTQPRDVLAALRERKAA